MIYRLYVSTFALDQPMPEACRHEMTELKDCFEANRAFDDAVDRNGPVDQEGRMLKDAKWHQWYDKAGKGFSFTSWEARCHGTITLIAIPGDEP